MTTYQGSTSDEKPINKLMAFVAAVILGGASGSFGLRIVDPPRSDPFTATNARELKEDILQDLRDTKNELERRIGRLQSQLEVISRSAEQWKLKSQSTQDKIEYHLRKHP